MAKQNRFEKISSQTQEEAMKSAQATKRPGQTKEQTKLIAQGIQKGINHYKKQQKSKSRELNKKLNKVSQTQTTPRQENNFSNIKNQKNENKTSLPWLILLISWAGFLTYFYYSTYL
ncbi:MAG: DUF2956 domain-containing protein [Methylococcaceae bacterium]|nr:DUF2956 domain-containing protein [Methylococcaceae bacterium]